MDKHTKLALILGAPLLPFFFNIIAIPVIVIGMMYWFGSGVEAMLSLPLWVLALTAGALVAGTASCVLGRLKGVYLAPFIAVALVMMSGLAQANHAMWDAVAGEGTSRASQLGDIAGSLFAALMMGLPWLLAVAVIGISVAHCSAYAMLLKSRHAAGAAGESTVRHPGGTR